MLSSTRLPRLRELAHVPQAVAVSLMITTAQKARLRELGLADAEIAEMRPAEAHSRLGLVR